MNASKRIILLSFAFVPWLFSCEGKGSRQPDAKVQKLEQEVSRLTEENRRLEEEMQSLQTQMEAHLDAQTIPSTSVQAQKPEMTLDRLKQQIAPALKEAILKMKKVSETPKKGRQFGMRMQYDTPAAVYGLITTGDSEVPYRAKVIVKYEKFLESEKKSDSYGSGSTTFFFALKKNRWVLENFQ
jgi:hypothetical protein